MDRRDNFKNLVFALSVLFVCSLFSGCAILKSFENNESVEEVKTVSLEKSRGKKVSKLSNDSRLSVLKKEFDRLDRKSTSSSRGVITKVNRRVPKTKTNNVIASEGKNFSKKTVDSRKTAEVAKVKASPKAQADKEIAKKVSSETEVLRKEKSIGAGDDSKGFLSAIGSVFSGKKGEATNGVVDGSESAKTKLAKTEEDKTELVKAELAKLKQGKEEQVENEKKGLFDSLTASDEKTNAADDEAKDGALKLTSELENESAEKSEQTTQEARAMLALPGQEVKNSVSNAAGLAADKVTEADATKVPVWVFLLMAIALAVAGFSLMWVSRQSPATK